jgi:hypothetical protein
MGSSALRDELSRPAQPRDRGRRALCGGVLARDGRSRASGFSARPAARAWVKIFSRPSTPGSSNCTCARAPAPASRKRRRCATRWSTASGNMSLPTNWPTSWITSGCLIVASTLRTAPPRQWVRAMPISYVSPWRSITRPELGLCPKLLRLDTGAANTPQTQLLIPAGGHSSARSSTSACHRRSTSRSSASTSHAQPRIRESAAADSCVAGSGRPWTCISSRPSITRRSTSTSIAARPQLAGPHGAEQSPATCWCRCQAVSRPSPRSGSSRRPHAVQRRHADAAIAPRLAERPCHHAADRHRQQQQRRHAAAAGQRSPSFHRSVAPSVVSHYNATPVHGHFRIGAGHGPRLHRLAGQ